MMENSTRKPTVLIVDDSPESIDVLRSLLQQDYHVQPAIHGELALRLAQRFAPDVILLDVMMPDMDGYEVCRRLKSDNATANIPVIFITTLSEAVQEARGFSIRLVSSSCTTKTRLPARISLASGCSEDEVCSPGLFSDTSKRFRICSASALLRTGLLTSLLQLPSRKVGRFRHRYHTPQRTLLHTCSEPLNSWLG